MEINKAPGIGKSVLADGSAPGTSLWASANFGILLVGKVEGQVGEDAERVRGGCDR
jgi:hypothetical protein